MAVMIGSARCDERGKATGGKAGDQTGKELSTQVWYAHKKGWRVFRCKDPRQAAMIADDCRWACNNRHIGYDQGQRLTLYNAAKPYKFDCAEVKTNCETDCSALVRVCCAYAGIMLPNFNTTTEPTVLLKSGEFIELTGGKYTSRPDYLRKGDILCTKTKGHTAIVLTDGPMAELDAPIANDSFELGERLLKNGSTGPDVKQLQQLLIGLGYDCGRWGADGDFGDATEIAVGRFQADHHLETDGEYGPKTHKALMDLCAEEDDEYEPRKVQIVDGQCWLRESPGVTGSPITVLQPGTVLPFDGEVRDGWLLVEYKGAHGTINGWVSGKYGRLID